MMENYAIRIFPLHNFHYVRPFHIVAQKTEYRDISGQFLLKSHLIVTKTRDIVEKIEDRFKTANRKGANERHTAGDETRTKI